MTVRRLADEDVFFWHMDLSRILSALPSADTLFIPSGAYKMSMNEPRVLLSMEDYESDVEQLGVSPNQMPAEAPGDTAIDISAGVLSDPRAAFLASISFTESLRQGQGMAVGLYKVFEDVGNQIQDAIDTQKKSMEHFESDEEGAWSEVESEEDEPLIQMDLPKAYEIQIRGVNRTPPCIEAPPMLSSVVFLSGLGQFRRFASTRMISHLKI